MDSVDEKIAKIPTQNLRNVSSPDLPNPIGLSYKSDSSINNSVPIALRNSTEGNVDKDTLDKEDESLFIKKV